MKSSTPRDHSAHNARVGRRTPTATPTIRGTCSADLVAASSASDRHESRLGSVAVPNTGDPRCLAPPSLCAGSAAAAIAAERTSVLEGDTQLTTRSTNGNQLMNSSSSIDARDEVSSVASTPTIAIDDAEVREVTAKDVRDACISTKTQQAYRGSLRAISKWIIETKKHESSVFFGITGEIDLKRFILAEFEAFLLEKRKTVSVSTLNVYRSAVKDLYRRQDIPLPESYVKNMATFFSGLKRMQAAKYQSGAPIESGKDPLLYSLYQQLCSATLSRQYAGFAHLFLTTQWNLMCRSESVQTLCTEHLSAHDDSVGCVMYKSKTNQEGKGPKDPRHVYANPQSPTTCWITALAIYLACRPMQPAGPLFPGSQQKVRFGNTLRHLTNEKTGQSHYGTHSIRKGVATFACSGTTGGPSIASVRLGVGWSLGGVQDRYIRYESAGDQYLGCVVAGLPLNRADFAVLPPHFVDNQESKLGTCVEEMFPSLKNCSGLQDILKLCIASLVYHHEFLREAMPASHPLLSTFRFRHQDMLSDLHALLFRGASSWMKPTGIPPHVELYKQLLHMQKSIDNLPPVLLEGMSNLIQEKEVAAGNITKQMLESPIESLLVCAGLTQGPVPQASRTTLTSDGDHVYNYGGKFHLLPETFEFPRTGQFGAWQLWWFGNKARGYPPPPPSEKKSPTRLAEAQRAQDFFGLGHDD